MARVDNGVKPVATVGLTQGTLTAWRIVCYMVHTDMRYRTTNGREQNRAGVLCEPGRESIRFKSVHSGHGSRLDDVLRDEGVLEDFQATAIKEVIAWQIQQTMTEKKLSKYKMALLMKTSRAQLDRLLDPAGGNVTLETLQRAASVLGRSIRLELV